MSGKRTVSIGFDENPVERGAGQAGRSGNFGKEFWRNSTNQVVLRVSCGIFCLHVLVDKEL